MSAHGLTMDAEVMTLALGIRVKTLREKEKEMTNEERHLDTDENGNYIFPHTGTIPRIGGYTWMQILQMMKEER